MVDHNNTPPGNSVISLRSWRWLAIIVAVGLALAWSACATGQHESRDDWMRGYLDDPDRVWAGCLQVLDDLGYEVEEKDRIEGTIRAVATDDVPHKGVVLQIDQIKRTDVVRVHVFAGESGGGQHPDVNTFAAAAGAFLDALDVMLGVEQ
jgi:hypothetical protein